ncbi:MAG: MBL fold metallo-hydrolase [Clostridia bacterium]|nr:MBL fold metallo-hydrolase [Clostridia bacterium]
MKINCYSSYQMASNSYLVYDEESKQGFLVDAGCPAEKLIEEIDRLGISVQAVLFTHGHFDHIVGASGLQKRGYPLYIGEKDAPMLSSDKASMGAYFGFSTESAKADVLLKGGEELCFGGIPVRVLATPGHTEGGVCYLVDESVLFSGDTLFQGSIGRTDFPGGSLDTLLSSIRTQIFSLFSYTRVLPGHDEETTVGAEMATNPFLITV